MTLTWHDLEGEFNFDGSWRDVVVLHTNMADWQAVLEAIRLSSMEVRYSVANEVVPLPAQVHDAFPEAGFCDRLLQVRVGTAWLHCYFFEEETIEFDLDPREFGSQTGIQHILLFMALLACATKKTVALTPENSHSTPNIEVEPDGVVRHIRWVDGRRV